MMFGASRWLELIAERDRDRRRRRDGGEQRPAVWFVRGFLIANPFCMSEWIWATEGPRP